MKRTSKVISLLLVVVMLVSVMAGCNNTGGNGGGGNGGGGNGGDGGKKASGSIIYGTTTEISGDFFTTMWGNNASDAVIKDLIHGYGTIAYQKSTGDFAPDPQVVKKHEVTENADGTKTYKFDLQEDLTFNDGSKITAQHYVFAILAGSNPAFKEAGAKSITAGYYYDGYDAYQKGETDVFKGVRLLGDYSFSVTISAAELPNYDELTLVGVGPWAMQVIAPNAKVEDTGDGTKLTGEFSADVLNQTVVNETGYRYAPKVTCGPYYLDNYDKATKIATLKVNEKYKGDYTGQKPQIETIVIKKTNASTEIDELLAGTVDILPQVGGKDAIVPGLDAVDEDKIAYSTFPRNGFGFLSFICDLGPTQFLEVRQAIACLLDTPEFAKTYSGGYASTVNGHYGVAQWMYKDNKAAIEKDLDKYDFDLARAEKLLVDGGWTLDENGGEYVKGEGKIRHKKLDDGTLMPLHLKHMASTDNPVTQLIGTMLPANMKEVGMGYEVTEVDFSVLLDNYYGDVPERQYHMFNLATGFNQTYDVSLSYSDDPQYGGIYNSEWLFDKELSDLATALKNTKPGDKETYSSRWLAFQKKWNQLCPMIPLYSDEYYAFYSKKLKNYDADGFWTFAYAILYATVEE